MRISDWSSDVCSSDLVLLQVEADYYVLLNSDVEVSTGWIGPVIELMESDARIAACQPKVKDHGQRNKFEYAGDRKRVVKGKRVSVRVYLGGRRILKNKNTIASKQQQHKH